MKYITIRNGETLSSIALDHLGAASRWPEIYKLNIDTIAAAGPKIRGKPVRRVGNLTGADLIYPGTPLMVPAK
jgi:nucleoid-associated protein YgaU